jgi:uncharacterized protein (TIGR03435 family)
MALAAIHPIVAAAAPSTPRGVGADQEREAASIPIVASIKPSADNEPGWVIRPTAKGSYSAVKTTVPGLIAAAFALTPQQITGAPLPEGRYDIEARFLTAGAATPIPATTVLLQTLLRDRFGLQAHYEKRESAVYLLKPVRSDGRLGPKLTRSSVQCGDSGAADAARTRGVKAANGAPACGAIENPEAFIASGVTMDLLARALRPAAGRPVVNATNLTGTWDVTLEFAPLGAVTADKPAIFTVLQESLGLKLEPSTTLLDVLVVDAIHAPTAN